MNIWGELEGVVLLRGARVDFEVSEDSLRFERDYLSLNFLFVVRHMSSRLLSPGLLLPVVCRLYSAIRDSNSISSK